MAAIFIDPIESLKAPRGSQSFGVIKEEIEGLIRVFKDGHVERPEIVPCVSSATLPPELGVISRDVVVDQPTNVWARFYAPTVSHAAKLPLLVYFHGGGFCVGSAAWSCYHEFLAKLAAKSSCLIMSVNYRLAPENPLPAAYEDGFKALVWLKQRAADHRLHTSQGHQWWSRRCDFARIFLAGDSAGANIAYNLSTRLASNEDKSLRPLVMRGLVMLQPFFGGEMRTSSERSTATQASSALSLAASDTYWRLALPAGANRDHPWSNPLGNNNRAAWRGTGSKTIETKKLLPTLVCVSEMDILRDRNLEFCGELGRRSAAVKKKVVVEWEVYGGVGHAFQVLSKSQLSQTRCFEMMGRIRDFVSGI